MSEKLWQQQVLEIFQWNRWSCFHVFDSRRSRPGWPDLFAIHESGDRLVAELKTEHGKTTAAQDRWLNLFELAAIDAYVWRPSQVDQVVARAQKPNRVSTPTS